MGSQVLDAGMRGSRLPQCAKTALGRECFAPNGVDPVDASEYEPLFDPRRRLSIRQTAGLSPTGNRGQFRMCFPFANEVRNNQMIFSDL